MAEALVSLVVEQLGSIMVRELEQDVRLVVGVETEVKKLTSNLTAIKAVLADAETKQVKEDIVRDWLEKLKDVAYDIEDVLDDWEAAILSSQCKPGERKVCSFLQASCFYCKQVVLRHDIARKIKEMNERLDGIGQEKEHYHFVRGECNSTIVRPMFTSMIDITEVKGREEDKNVLVKRLLSEHSDDEGSYLRVFSIVGMGGIGKTTLAQFAFNDDKVNDYFDKKIWVSVSDPFDETRVAKAILESLSGSTPSVNELENLLQKIGESIEGKRILLIMDDVWEEDDEKWNKLKPCLRSASSKSKILVTTRKKNVASVMGCFEDDIWEVNKLSNEQCWLIIKKIAFCGKNDTEYKYLKRIGIKISKKCGGLPLAAKALGGILRFRKTREEWQSILDSEVWEVEVAQRKVMTPLWLSYYDLSPTLKRCFSYCAIFPKGHKIEKEELIGLWMAQGYLKEGQSDDLEITGENYFQNLAMRFFFQDFQKDPFQKIQSCKMHDIVHDFAQIVARNECLSVQVNGPTELTIGSLSSKVRHLRLDCTNSRPSFNSFDGAKKWRSLLICGSPCEKLPLTTENLSRLFSESTHVRSLSLTDGDFEEIPSSINKLIHLKWLDLSRNRKLEQLPETLCELHSLQTIDVSFCSHLEGLPLGIGELISLRHLRNFLGPCRLPKAIAQLTGLRTLEVVNVGRDGDAFSLGDLKNLNQLRGSLKITNLGACNHHVDEAKQAKLKKKKHIKRLVLGFSDGEVEKQEHLLEALEPSPYLEILWIYHYGDTTFPGWMISLRNLRQVKLFWCNGEHLPSLGKLPSLETLHLWEVRGVKKVGLELLGIKNQIGDIESEIPASASSSSSSASSPVVAFPKLTELQFSKMYSWEEWDDYYEGTAKPRPITIMPSLRSLKIIACPRLKALPDYILQNTMLETLYMGGSDRLEERYNKKKGEDWSKISHFSCVDIF